MVMWPTFCYLHLACTAAVEVQPLLFVNDCDDSLYLELLQLLQICWCISVSLPIGERDYLQGLPRLFLVLLLAALGC